MSLESTEEHIGELVRLATLFVHRELESWPEFVAALIIGSVAHGEARADSDVDCIFILDEVDERIVPAEFVWVPATGAYHTISEVEASEVGGVQLDAQRVALAEFRRGDWAEGMKHDLTRAIVVSDRDGTAAHDLGEHLRYPVELRRSRIIEHYGRAAYYSEAWRLEAWGARGGLACAHDQLNAAFEEVVKLLHAYNAVWLPWRYRWLVSTATLPWLPTGFGESVNAVVGRVSLSRESLAERREAIVRALDAIGDELRATGLLPDPEEAFSIAHPELGYGHNMDAWRKGHQRLLRERRG